MQYLRLIHFNMPCFPHCFDQHQINGLTKRSTEVLRSNNVPMQTKQLAKQDLWQYRIVGCEPSPSARIAHEVLFYEQQAALKVKKVERTFAWLSFCRSMFHATKSYTSKCATSTARSSGAFCSGNTSIATKPAPNSVPAKYLSLSLVR
jgi:hypothetical protein